MTRVRLSGRMKYRIGRCMVFTRSSKRRMKRLRELILKHKYNLYSEISPSRSGFIPKIALSETPDVTAIRPSISGWGMLAGEFHITKAIPVMKTFDLYQAAEDEREDVASPSVAASVSPSVAASVSPSVAASVRDDVDAIRRYLAAKLGFYEPDSGDRVPDVERVLTDLSLDGVVEWMKGERCKNVITLAGAGISTSAGIPDFRSPVSGLYHNLQKYNLPEPQAIFEINFFRQNPKPFFALAKELFPGNFKPTVSHYFIKLLHDKGVLLRHYTQNIDTLERGAGLPADKLVEAHGTFYTSHCLECRKQYDLDFVKEHVFSDRIPICTECPGVVKPDIVFFGESMPSRFHDCMQEDFRKCDLLIIMGSSLEVQPFALLIDMVPEWCPRLLLNRERAGQRSAVLRALGLSGGGLRLDGDAVRDVMWRGDCDVGCQQLADKLGWGKELRELVAREHARLDAETDAVPPSTETRAAASPAPPDPDRHE